MPCRFVVPQVVRLALSGDDWIEIKAELTAGEARAMFDQMYARDAAGVLRTIPFETGPATVIAYLVDWNLTDPAGKVVPIRDVTDPVARLKILDGLAIGSFTEIYERVTAYVDAREADPAKKSAPPGSAPT